MKDQLPVETRYGVLWNGQIHGVYELVEDAEEEAVDCVQFDKKLGTAQIVDLEIRPMNQPPCEWELSPFGEVGGEPNTKTWLCFITDFGYKYCPMCGRLLTKEGE